MTKEFVVDFNWNESLLENFSDQYKKCQAFPNAVSQISKSDNSQPNFISLGAYIQNSELTLNVRPKNLQRASFEKKIGPFRF